MYFVTAFVGFVIGFSLVMIGGFVAMVVINRNSGPRF